MDLSLGGDPTGIVSNVRWQSWGGAQATGTGTTSYVGPNQSVANASQETATVVAFKLATCQGVFAYGAIEWYFPQHGQVFDPNRYIDTCTGQRIGQ
ncbi:MAG: hypothetical protein M3N98_14620 [Actinomycetota bacterium]|nr:hypothetical protein [Actinomycetota bacterium]